METAYALIIWLGAANIRDNTISQTRRPHSVYDGTTLAQVQTLASTHYPNNAAMDSNGDFVGGLNGIYDADDVYVYDPTGYLLGTVPTTSYSYNEGQGDDLMVVSGHSSRVISATGPPYNSNQTLMFRSLL